MSIHITKKGSRATGADANNLFKAFTKVCAASEPAPFTDTERLEWLIENRCMLGNEDGYYLLDRYQCAFDPDHAEAFNSPREAIDDAIRREKGQR